MQIKEDRDEIERILRRNVIAAFEVSGRDAQCNPSRRRELGGARETGLRSVDKRDVESQRGQIHRVAARAACQVQCAPAPRQMRVDESARARQERIGLGAGMIAARVAFVPSEFPGHDHLHITMERMAEWLGAAALAAWIYLLVGRGGFWLIREAEAVATTARSASVVAIIPARDEAETIGQAIASLPDLPIIVADDQSTDGTAEVARRAGERVTVVEAGARPEGWTGKVWAMNEGLRAARTTAPDYYLLTDADIVHAPDQVRSLVARAETANLDLASLMVRLPDGSLAERALLPAFVYFFFMLYPPAWGAGAAGACILIRRAALERIGGFDAIRGEFIDDCALAREVKRSGGRVWLGVTRATESLRRYATLGDVGSMISRTAFTQLRYSATLLLGTIAAMALIFVAPPVLALSGQSFTAWGAWLLMSASFWPALRYYRRSPLWAPALPLIALFYMGATVHSAIRYWSGRGGIWKGRRVH